MLAKEAGTLTVHGPREMEDEIAWERAAQMLDLDRRVVQGLRIPRIEWVSRHECASGAAALYGAISQVSSNAAAAVLVGRGIDAAQITKAAVESQMQLALAGSDDIGAAIGLRVPSDAISETELFELARDCAAVVSRMIGTVRLVPADVMATCFANWLVSIACQHGAKLAAPRVSPEKYLTRVTRHEAETIAQFCGLALDEIGKKLRSSRMTVLGADTLGLACMREVNVAGGRVIAVADESGALINETGLDVAALLQHIENGGLAAEYSEAQHIVHAEALAIPADVLLLGGGKVEVTESNARSVAASILIEAAKGSIAPEAQEELSARGVTVIPHSLISSCRWINPRPDPQAEAVWSELSRLRRSFECSLPTATRLLSWQRLAERERIAHP